MLSIAAIRESIAKGPKKQALEDGAKTTHVKMKAPKKHKAPVKKTVVQDKQHTKINAKSFHAKKALLSQAQAKKGPAIAHKNRLLRKLKIAEKAQEDKKVAPKKLQKTKQAPKKIGTLVAQKDKDVLTTKRKQIKEKQMANLKKSANRGELIKGIQSQVSQESLTKFLDIFGPAAANSKVAGPKTLASQLSFEDLQKMNSDEGLVINGTRKVFNPPVPEAQLRDLLNEPDQTEKVFAILPTKGHIHQSTASLSQSNKFGKKSNKSVTKQSTEGTTKSLDKHELFHALSVKRLDITNNLKDK